ncbi:NAD(+) diphosphatase [Paraglaciecola sp. 20A4]|uniref:NAD(+) diphosphatase n=1 Tax=Paraglaciecola sp. 20A4 TaxID=2687288 RepID=UPI00140BAE95|nr:NAD(+) diphosphatase [Paraglaciecola sp. 20A4]
MIKQNIQIQGDSQNIWFIFSAEKLLVPFGQPGPLIETWDNLQFAHAYKEQVVQIGEHNGQTCYLVDMGNEQVLQQDIHLTHLRSLLMQDDLEVFAIAARAWQVALFLRTHRFCGQCGSTMQKIDWEMAMHCHRCNHRCYPRISPCIIVAIRNGDKILLAQGKPQKERNMFSTLAGFVESGETLEHAVHREVFEEVGVAVKNLRYVSSQPWPFPHSLMVGFLADFDSGDIKVDGHEIIEAHWFKYDELPNIPPKFSIAGQLIERTIEEICAD